MVDSFFPTPLLVQTVYYLFAMLFISGLVKKLRFLNPRPPNLSLIDVTLLAVSRTNLTMRMFRIIYNEGHNRSNKKKHYIITRSGTAVDLRYLKVKEDISLTKNYCIKSVRFINSL